MKKRLIIMAVALLILLVVFSFVGYSIISNKSSEDKAFEQTTDDKLYNIIYQKDGGVSSSSNPYEYIKNPKGNKDYKYIVSQGDKSLNYMLKEFASSDKNGLREYIMAIACSEILKENSASKK